MSATAPATDEADALRRKVKGLTKLATLPDSVRKVGSMIESGTGSAADFAEEIGKDQVLSAKVLRLVNSGFCGFRSPVNTISHAIVLLGIDSLRMLLYGTTVLGLADSAKMHGLWRHSLGTARASGVLAERLELPKHEELAVAGLLHDIGKIVIVQVAPEKARLIADRIERRGGLQIDAERDVLGVTHLEVGGWLAERWSLPPRLTAPVIFHNDFGPGPGVCRPDRRRARGRHCLSGARLRVARRRWCPGHRPPSLDVARRLDVGRHRHDGGDRSARRHRSGVMSTGETGLLEALGKPVAILSAKLVLLDDITDQVETERLFGDARDYLDRVLNHLPVGVIVFDADGRTTFFNASQATLSGALGFPSTLTDVIGARISAIYPVLDEAVWRETLDAVVTTREPVVRDRVAVPATDPTTYLNLQLYPLTGRGESVAAVVCVTEDISRLVELEQDLVKKERLAVAGQLVATFHHQINNPLVAILGMAEMMLYKDALDEELKGRVERIRDGALRIAEVTKKMREIREMGRNEWPQELSTLTDRVMRPSA